MRGPRERYGESSFGGGVTLATDSMVGDGVYGFVPTAGVA